MEPINSYGFISSIKFDNLNPWYTTIENNQIIEFKDASGDKKQLNSLYIEAENTPLFIRILPSDYCIYSPANSSQGLNSQRIESMQVMNILGTKFRWYGQWY